MSVKDLPEQQSCDSDSLCLVSYRAITAVGCLLQRWDHVRKHLLLSWFGSMILLGTVVSLISVFSRTVCSIAISEHLSDLEMCQK